jgi:hypothetical protein
VCGAAVDARTGSNLRPVFVLASHRGRAVYAAGTALPLPLAMIESQSGTTLRLSPRSFTCPVRALG